MTQPVEAELLPLLRLLRRAQGFALAFLKCNVPAERERLVGVLSESLKESGRSGRLLQLQEPVVDLLEAIRGLDPPLGPNDAVFVLGFEKSIPAEIEFPPALVKLNLARELFRELPCPLVLVLPDYALTKLARQAPDFWAWRSGVFEVEVPGERLETIMSKALRWPRLERWSDSSERVRGYLAVLQEVLSEYEVRSSSDREKLDLLLRIAASFYSLGELDKAGASAEQAIELARKLGALLEEATGLHVLAGVLLRLGRAQEALPLAERGVYILRTSLRKDLDDLVILASALSLLGSIHGYLGNSEDALEILEEAVEVSRQLAAKSPEEFLPTLTTALDLIGWVLEGLGRREEALAVVEDSLRNQRYLTAKGPQLFLPDLALSLSTSSRLLHALERQEEALVTAQEAVEIYQSLAAKRPEWFESRYASALRHLGTLLRAQGRTEEASAVEEEASQLQRGGASPAPRE